MCAYSSTAEAQHTAAGGNTTENLLKTEGRRRGKAKSDDGRIRFQEKFLENISTKCAFVATKNKDYQNQTKNFLKKVNFSNDYYSFVNSVANKLEQFNFNFSIRMFFMNK